MSVSRWVFIAVLAASAVACRADPGEADYSSHVGIQNEAPFIESDNPFEPGTPRIGFGLTESEVTEDLGENSVSRFLFIFDTAGDGTGAFTLELYDSRVRTEGQRSLGMEVLGQGFWGVGMFWYIGQDISEFSNLYMSVQSSDPTFTNFPIAMQSGLDRAIDPTESSIVEASVNASNYGWANDGEWHDLVIPLADFAAAGVDLRSIRSPWLLSGAGGDLGEVLRVDDVYIE